MKKILSVIALGVTLTLAVSCDLTEYNPNKYSPKLAYGSEDAIQLAVNAFYSAFPNISGAYSGDGSNDYVCTPFAFANRYCVGYSADNAGQTWDGWKDLRNINLFLENMNSPACGVEGEVKEDFIAQGRFFRAYWYYGQLRTYGDVPWIDRVIRSDEPDYEYQDRSSRDIVMLHILEDLDYAIDHIKRTSANHTTLTRDVCLFVKMQACLYEASFRKYNNITASVRGEAFTNYTVDNLYRLSAEAAEQIISSGKYKLIDNYRDLFLSENLQLDEVILGAETSETVKGSQNQYYNSSQTYRSFIRSFINTYLMKDGSPYTSKSGYETETFAEEFKNRDPRLGAIVRTPGYRFGGKAAVPVVPAPSPVGYHIIKFTTDRFLDGEDDQKGGLNTNAVPIYRYAEVLLSYAEAKAELGEMSASIWSSTVGAIRRRAGISGNLDLPTTVDPYLKANFYADVDNAALMEIRRERACELCLEGRRNMDLLRWGCGSLLASSVWTGINIPALEEEIDLDGDGTKDYFFTVSDSPTGVSEGVMVVKVNGDALQAVRNGAVYQLRFDCLKQRNWDANNRLILAPIPEFLIEKYRTRGYTMTQNPGY